MKKLIVLLLLVSGSAHADWSRVANFDHGDFYVDKQTLSVKGGIREVWSLMDYRYAQMDTNKNIYRSTRSMLQLDCPDKKARIIHMSFYTGQMLRGNEITKMGMLKDWEPVPPDTPIRRILESVCAI